MFTPVVKTGACRKDADFAENPAFPGFAPGKAPEDAVSFHRFLPLPAIG